MVPFAWRPTGLNGGPETRGTLGISDESQLNGSVNAARHGISNDGIGWVQYRMINVWNIGCKNRSACGDVEPNGGAE